MNDFDYYSYSEEEAKAQAAADRASSGLMYAVFRLIFLPFRLFFLLLPSVLCVFLVLRWLHKPFTKATQWDYFWWLCATVHIIECLIFFLKGSQLSLRDRGNQL